MKGLIEKNIFPCTSVRLKKFLMNKSLEYFNVYINEEGMTIWQFARTPKLKEALKEWVTMRNIN